MNGNFALINLQHEARAHRQPRRIGQSDIKWKTTNLCWNSAHIAARVETQSRRHQPGNAKHIGSFSKCGFYSTDIGALKNPIRQSLGQEHRSDTNSRMPRVKSGSRLNSRESAMIEHDIIDLAFEK